MDFNFIDLKNNKSLLIILSVIPCISISNTFFSGIVFVISFIVSAFISSVITIIAIKLLSVKPSLIFYIIVSTFSSTFIQLIVNIFITPSNYMIGVYISCFSLNIFILYILDKISNNNLKLNKELFVNFIPIISIIPLSMIRELFGKGHLFINLHDNGGITIFKEAPLPILETTAGGLLFAALFILIVEFIYKGRNVK